MQVDICMYNVCMRVYVHLCARHLGTCSDFSLVKA